MSLTSNFTARDYESRDLQTRRSAKEILKIVFDYIQPESVVDFGCGVGTWLSVCLELGSTEVLGFDGDWVPPELMQLQPSAFQRVDLTKPITLPGSYDLSISLEVAEHLPEASAAQFVDSIVSAAPYVLFSAAIPFQTGNGHVNEQWQAYWASLFKNHDYVAIDLIRPRVWDSDIAVHYRQNTVFYAKMSRVSEDDRLLAEFNHTTQAQLNLVHPDVYLHKHRVLQERAGERRIVSGREAVRGLVDSVGRRLKRVLPAR